MVTKTTRKYIRKPDWAGRDGRRGLGVTAPNVAGVARTAALGAGAMQAFYGARRNTMPANIPKSGLSGTEIVVGRRKPRRDGPGKVELDFQKHRYGKKKDPTLGLLRTLALNRICVRYQGVNRLGSIAAPACPGYHLLEARLVSSTGTGGVIGAGTGASVLPLHLFELSSVNNATPRPAGYELRIADNGECGFAPLKGQSSTGVDVDAQPYVFEFGDSSSVNSSVRFVNLLWSDVKLMLHGATAETVSFDIMVVTFDPRYSFLDPATSLSGLSVQESQQRHSFWQTMSRSLVVNPAMHGNADKMTGMRVLRRYRHVLQPSSNTDINDEPQAKSVNIFLRRNWVIDLKENSTPITSDVGQFSLGYRVEDLSSTQFSSIPKAGQRQYLIIRALNTVQREGAATRSTTPSYDISIRRKMEFNKVP